jgi:hypothetical protein
MATKKKQKKARVPKIAEVKLVEAKKPTPGVYVYKPLKSKIVECDCGNKYIATRPRQKTCLDCVKEQMLATR